MSRRLRIGIDAHAIGLQQTGNERFIENILRELRDACDHDLYLYFVSRSAADAAEKAAGGDQRTRIRVLRPGRPLGRLLFALPRAVREDRLDVLLVQYTAARRIACPVVTVVHDVSFASHPEYFRRRQLLWMRREIPATMKRAARIVTVSKFSAGEIQRLYSIPQERLAVVADAADPRLRADVGTRIPVDPPFFLAVGTIELRKNLEMLVRAFRRTIREHPQVRERLVIAGPDGFGADRVHQVVGEASNDVQFLGYVDDATLAGLLRASTALLYPSLYEGFGLPVVEAMAAGVPALVSDIPVMREIAQDAAIRLPGDDERAWAAALADIALNPAHRTEVVKAGARRAEQFSWRKSAQNLLNVLEEAAGP